MLNETRSVTCVAVEWAEELERKSDAMKKALIEIAELTERKQLPITAQINEIASLALLVR